MRTKAKDRHFIRRRYALMCFVVSLTGCLPAVASAEENAPLKPWEAGQCTMPACDEAGEEACQEEGLEEARTSNRNRGIDR